MSNPQSAGRALKTKQNRIYIWNRYTGKLEVELVFGEGYLRWLYESRMGNGLAASLCNTALFSRMYGKLQSSGLSARKIPRFIKSFDIKMDEYEAGPFRTFNEFFIRRFKPGVRKFTENPGELAAAAEARYLGFQDIKPSQTFPVKAAHLTPEAILGSTERAKPFIGGSVLIARLCPTDYHRFHFPDDGKILEDYRITGRFHSVSPVALSCRSEILATNERHVSIVETANFGRIAYVEVGALCVGKIVQTHPFYRQQHSTPRQRDLAFQRGDEKGYFLFGGSTVVLLGEPGRWVPDKDILEQTAQKRETFVRLGDRVAHKEH